ISSLLFADNVVLLASSNQDLQRALGRFAAQCEAAGMGISTSNRKRVACPLQVGGESLPQVEEFNEGRMEREIDRRIGATSAVMRSLYRSVVVKKELSCKAKLSIYRSIYVPTLTYGHELWVMTERIRSRIQAAEMSFLQIGRPAAPSHRERPVEVALFRMPPGRLPGEVRPRGRPRTRWRDYVSRLAWERLGVPPEELEEVSGERE
ncbi:hypothetical protein M9458_018141, partial [Cirrhinus mrigala]